MEAHLLLRLELLPHPDFRLEGRDLVTTVAVTPWEAALGGEADLATLDGRVRVRIPAGTSPPPARASRSACT